MQTEAITKWVLADRSRRSFVTAYGVTTSVFDAKHFATRKDALTYGRNEGFEPVAVELTAQFI
jgi:hypothetical protein